jgi:hypothetical protein
MGVWSVIVARSGSTHSDQNNRQLGGGWAISMYEIPMNVFTAIP